MIDIKKLSEEQKLNRKRILEIRHENHSSHLGSCLSSVDAIDAVYKIKKKNEKFVLSNGHAGIALYVILEKNRLIKSAVLKKLHIHPDRNPQLGIDVSTGSLGQGLPIALGIALSNRKDNAYCMISDGECTEGSIWESFRIASEKKLDNLKIIVNANGYGGYSKIDIKLLTPRFKAFGCAVFLVNGHRPQELERMLRKKIKNKPLVLLAKTEVEQLPFLISQDAHYKIMNNEDYAIALKEFA